jgi:hypothetical protein
MEAMILVSCVVVRTPAIVDIGEPCRSSTPIAPTPLPGPARKNADVTWACSTSPHALDLK